VKIKVHYCFLLILLSYLTACAPGHKVDNDHMASKTVQQATTYKGIIVHKSNRLQTITLKITKGKKSDKVTLSFDYQTRGLEYGVRGKQVIITCRVVDKGTCKAISIEPGGTIFAPGVEWITLHQLKKKSNAHREFILIDSRPGKEYRRCHLPGAISIPACAPQSATLLKSLDRDKTLIFYCGWPDCNRSTTLSGAASQAGFTDIKVLKGGLQAWIDKGHPTVASDGFILSGQAVLLDLRPAHKDAVRRIQGSISIPLPLLADKAGEIPPGAPVVIYASNLGESLQGLKTLREAGFSRVAMVEGNLQGWIHRDNRIVSGPAQTTIHWSHPLADGEISAARFTTALQGKSKAIILDVRTDRELTTFGRLKHAIHIPLFSLERRMEELDKSQTIYCAPGPRAKMACRELREQGYKAFFLGADLYCKEKKCQAQK